MLNFNVKLNSFSLVDKFQTLPTHTLSSPDLIRVSNYDLISSALNRYKLDVDEIKSGEGTGLVLNSKDSPEPNAPLNAKSSTRLAISDVDPNVVLSGSIQQPIVILFEFF